MTKPRLSTNVLWQVQQNHYGQDHVQVATTLGNLANVLDQMGDYDQAKALCERALAVQQNHYGQDHVEVATTLGNLAFVLDQMGDYDQAKALYERALAVQQNHYGQDHVQVATTLGNLAVYFVKWETMTKPRLSTNVLWQWSKITTAKTMCKWPQHLAI